MRPARLAPVEMLDTAEIDDGGIAGDHAHAGRRAVTLIQAEHLGVVATLAGRADVQPGLLRRNLVVAGLNLAALRSEVVAVGAARLRLTGPCPPCSRMEAALGPGGYNAMRGHGGWYAEVVAPGRVAVGDTVRPGEGA